MPDEEEEADVLEDPAQEPEEALEDIEEIEVENMAPDEPEYDPSDLPELHVGDDPGAGGKTSGMETIIGAVVLLIVGLLALIPLSMAGVITLGPTRALRDARQAQILVVSAVVLYGGLVAFLKSGETSKGIKPRVGGMFHHKTKRDLTINALAVGSTIVMILLSVVAFLAFLVYVGAMDATSSASIAFATNYTLFAALSLLVLNFLLIARTSFRTRVELGDRGRAVAYGAIPLSILVFIIGALVSSGLMSTGVFSGISPRQSVYIITVGVLFELVAFRLLLRYPSIAKLMLGALQAAKKAGRDGRDEIQKKAYRTYMIGLIFLMLSIFLVVLIAGRQVTVGQQKQTNFILLSYVSVAAVFLGVLVTRYLQHRTVEQSKKREDSGELIHKKKLEKEQITGIIIYSFSGFFGSLFLILGLLTLAGRLPVETKFGTDFLILTFLVGIGPYGFYRGFKIKRERAMDDKFPDLLRDLAESQRAGMTLPRALLVAAKGTYGALSPEIKKMSAQVEWGVSFTEALARFAKRANTSLIQRAVVLIREAAAAGGNVVDILTAAADDAREIKQILEERKRQMAIYSMIIYIAFFVYLVVIFVLAAQFLPGFEAAVSGGSGQQVGGLNLQGFDSDAFTTVFFHGALIQAIGGGLVAGVMTGGSPNDGLKHSVIMTIVSWVFFRVLI